MKKIKIIRVRLFALTVAAVMAIVLTSVLGVDAQDEMSGMKMGKKTPPKPAQSGMQMGQGAKKKAPKKSAGMGGKSGGMGMGMKDDMDMDDDMDMEGMCCMKMMGSMGASKMPAKKGMGGMKMSSSALPGFPGMSHLYHIGSTGFFLDHPTHITLTPDQQMTLNRMKEKATLEQSDADRKIAEAEQQMWQLTAADSPDADKIEAKTREVEKLRADQRLAFIRAVGEAAKVLTPEQQQVLLGAKPADAKKPMPSKMKMPM